MRNFILLIVTLSFLSIDSVWAKDNEHVAFLKQLVKEANHTTAANISSKLEMSKVEYSYKKKCFTIAMYIEFDNKTKKEIEAKYPSMLQAELFRGLAGQLIDTVLGENFALMTALEMDENNTGFLEHLVMSESKLSVVLKMPYLNVEKEQILSLEQLKNINLSDKDVLKLKFVIDGINKFLPLKISPSLTAEKCNIDKDSKFSTYVTIDNFSNTNDRIAAIGLALKFLSTKNSTTERLAKKGNDVFVVFTEKGTQQMFIDTIPSSLIKDIANYTDTLDYKTLSMLSTSIGGRTLFPRTTIGKDVEIIDEFYNLKNKTSNYIYRCRSTEKGKRFFSTQKRLLGHPKQFCFIANQGPLKHEIIGDTSKYTFYMISKDNSSKTDSVHVNIDNKIFSAQLKLTKEQQDSLNLQIAIIVEPDLPFVDTVYVQGNNIIREETRSEYFQLKKADVRNYLKKKMIENANSDYLLSAMKPFRKNLILRIRKPNGKNNEYIDILITDNELHGK